MTAQEAVDAVLAEAGATLPARDTVDLRITEAVRSGGGRVIEKETDLAPAERWPNYRSTIAADKTSEVVRLSVLEQARGQMVVLRLRTGEAEWHAGCPSASLVVIGN